MVRTVAVSTALMLLVVSVAGQQAPPRFEVASVRESLEPGAPTETPNRVTYSSVPLVWVMSRAFGIPEREILGGPDWIRTRRFAINARTVTDVSSRDEFMPMLRALLEDRFRLKAERIQNERPVYALSVARSDRLLGPKLKPTTSSCLVPGAFPSSALEFKTGDRGQQVLTVSRCGVSYVGGGGQSGPSVLAVFGSRVTMTQFVEVLTKMVDRPVIDHTGLTGEFDFQVLTSEVLSVSGDDLGGSQKLFAAIEGQLGLKLQPSRALVDVLVIQSVEPPTEN